MIERKKPESDLRNYYTIFLQFGLLLTLLIFIVAVKVDITSLGPEEIVLDEQEIVEMEEIVQTRQIETPPPPPRPPVPVEVPNDEIIEDVQININAEWDDGGMLSAPPPPPPDEDDEEEVFVVVEQMPEIIGGIEAIQRNVRYPEMARRAGIEGRVIVQFVVDEQGRVVDPVVVRGIGGGADEEALRAVQAAEFRPGMQRGRPVKVQFSVPVIFRLQN
ncbi:MAG: energy transducer TonB [Balneolaceae bacterium]